MDILFLPDSNQVLSNLKAAPVPVLANCLFTFGRSEVALNTFAESLPPLQALTQAKALVFAPSKLADFKLWLDPIFRELSHNQPFDVALRVASNQVTNNPASAIFFGSQFFIQAARPATQAKRLIGELRSTPSFDLQLNAKMSSHLGLIPGYYSAEIIGDQLEKVMDRFAYYYESAEATTLSTLTLTAEQAAATADLSVGHSVGLESLPSAKDLEPQPERIERFLQHQKGDRPGKAPGTCRMLAEALPRPLTAAGACCILA